MGQTVNLVAQPSQVRILLPPLGEIENTKPTGKSRSRKAGETQEGLGLSETNVCGCSSMVERQPSKLDTWVRFPSPATE